MPEITTEVNNEVTAEEVIPVFTKKKKRKLPKVVKRIIIIVLALAILGSAGYWVYNIFKKDPPKIETAFASMGSLQNIVFGSGTATPAKSADIVALAKGEVEEILVAVGARVNEGDLLMRVNDSELVTKRQDAMQIYEDALEAVNENYKKQVALTVKSPISGKVTNLTLKEGDMASEGTAVATIIDESALKLTLYYSTRYIDMIYVGQPADIFIPQTMDTVAGTVSEVVKMNKVSDEGAVLFQVTFRIPNPGALKEGMTASASLNSKETIMPYDSGLLEFWQSEVVFPEASGTITSIRVKDYMQVKAGDTLIKMENTDYADEMKNLQKTLDTATEAVKTVEEELKYYQITSPISGTVLAVNCNVGDQLDGNSTVIMSVADIDKMTIEAQIDELDVSKLQPGMMATIKVYTDKGEEAYMGTLTSIGLQGKIQNGFTYYPGIIEFAGSESLRSGMWVNFEITASSAEGVLIVPQKAVKNTEMGTVCLIRDPGEKPENFVELPDIKLPEGFIAVSVETGQSDAANIEIISGITEGTEVALGELADPNNGGMMGIY